MDQLRGLAMEAARAILAEDAENPGSQEPPTIQAARQLLSITYAAEDSSFPRTVSGPSCLPLLQISRGR
jgi:hypothetical protein